MASRIGTSSPSNIIFAKGDLPGPYARLAEKEKALDELAKHFDEPNVWQQVRFLPLHDPLRAEPRFKETVKRAGSSK